MSLQEFRLAYGTPPDGTDVTLLSKGMYEVLLQFCGNTHLLLRIHIKFQLHLLY